MQSCESIYYASASRSNNKLVIAKSEFLKEKKEKTITRNFVIVKAADYQFPICIYRTKEDNYIASLLECTHNSCELNVGGGIYTCPCHGSEFSTTGKVLEGPAINDLKTFKTTTDHENVYIILS